MKTPIKILLLFGMFLCLMSANAQTYYYNTSATFTEPGYTYLCNTTPDKSVILYNYENQFTFVKQTYSDGSYINATFDIDKFIPDVEDDTWTRSLSYAIVNNAFSPAEKIRINGKSFGIEMIIHPITGVVMEVHFTFTSVSPYATIPVSVYRTIELQLKSQIWFIPNAEGNRKNYLFCGWTQKVQ